MPTKSHTWGFGVLAGLLTITALIYSRTLAQYPAADDWVMLEPRSFLATFGFFVHSVIPAEFNALWFRPLPMFTFWLDNRIWPGAFWGPHLVNIVFHLANTILIWSLVSLVYRQVNPRSTERAVFPAFAAGLIYAIHPLTAEPVSWIAARFDLMTVTFGIAALLFWFKWSEQPERKRWITWCILCLAAALLSKEQGIVFPAAVGMSCLYDWFQTRNTRTYLPPMLIITGMVLVYIPYRVMLFHGLGGYLESQQALSLRIPIAYFLALLFPYPNLAPQWQANAFLGVILLLFAAFMVFAGFLPYQKSRKPAFRYLFAGILVVLFGLATTAPHAGMKMWSILGHNESRFALISIAGLAVCAGIGFMFLHSLKAQRIALILLGIWGLTALWRTDVQIAAWKASSETARAIVETTVREVPDPNPGSTLYYFDIPSFSKQYAYIFGIGLSEAVMRRYPGRHDITIDRTTTEEDLGQARPDVDYVFLFRDDRLERLHPQVRQAAPQ